MSNLVVGLNLFLFTGGSETAKLAHDAVVSAVSNPLTTFRVCGAKI
jgi:hypothetical protein